ncbi:MAG: FtsX-like permease family protein [Candidatus Wallbacteria bacterium]|nr:FtsX-like permease family protein [Candidatus Wallbacteria bacterium]MBI4865948.1 FtsX-like permease family protein [Candidatus Wallbacteria bacterium]
MRFLPLVLKNLRRNTRRTALTMGSIAVSLFLFTALLNVMATMDRIEHRSDGSLRIAVHHKMSLAFTMPEAYRQKLERVPGIVAVCPFTWYGGVFRDPKNMFTTLSVDESTFQKVWGDMFEFQPGEWERFEKTRTGAIVGKSTCEKFGWKVGDKITLTGTVSPVNLEFEICAIPVRDFDPRSLLFHRKYLEEALGNPGVVSNFWCRIERAELIPSIMQQVDQMFANSQWETLAETEKSFANNFMSMMGNIKVMVGGIGMIVMLTIMLVAANSVAMSVRERTTEVAVLKAIGFRPSHVLAFILGESTLIAFIGGLAGTLSAYAMLSSHAFTSKLGPMGALFLARPDVVALGLAVAVLVGAAAGLVPAMNAARLRIVDALRQVA